MTKLLPCPCCGSEAGFAAEQSWADSYIYCYQCELRTEPCDDIKIAIKAWNTRPKKVVESSDKETIAPLSGMEKLATGGIVLTDQNGVKI